MSPFWTPPSNTTTSITNPPKILYEISCENQGTCTNDIPLYKGLTAQWLSAAEWHDNQIITTTSPVLQASANGAAAACSGGQNGTKCGEKWTSGKNDYKTGIEQELAALDVVLSNLAATAKPAKAEINYEGTGASASGSGAAGPSSTAAPPSKGKNSGVALRPAAGLAVGAVFAALVVCL